MFQNVIQTISIINFNEYKLRKMLNKYVLNLDELHVAKNLINKRVLFMIYAYISQHFITQSYRLRITHWCVV